MGNTPSVFLSDEELGKKDDDHRTDHARRARFHIPGGGLTSARIQPRKALKRLFIVVFAGLLVYVFVKNMPTGVPARNSLRPQYVHPPRPPPNDGPSKSIGQPRHEPLLAPKPASAEKTTEAKMTERAPSPSPEPSVASGGKTDEVENAVDSVAAVAAAAAAAALPRFYKGPVKFERLALSLQAFGKAGASKNNKNILFAASNLKSAATLLQVACQMGWAKQNTVHFALMSRSDITLDDLQHVNGIDDTCRITFHDARPNLSSMSADVRLEDGAWKALHYLNMYMHPRAVIVDSFTHEELFFSKAVRKHIAAEGTPVIELPASRVENFLWLTKLDSMSLAGTNDIIDPTPNLFATPVANYLAVHTIAWNDVNVEVVIHAAPGTAGSLIRLLTSLRRSADFVSSSISHITIELPHKIDTPTQRFLRTFRWPPQQNAADPTNSHHVSLRHRIPRAGLTEEESSVRFLESFWPVDPSRSHVLVLSPQVELAEDFFLYLKYAILEYKYSSKALARGWDRRLLGVSLDVPDLYLNASAPFEPPQRQETVESGPIKEEDAATPFLWQAPNSNAALYFGEKWAELHEFLSQNLESQHPSEQKANPSRSSSSSSKVVSKKYPAWLEHALRLSRAKGYWTLYPSKPMSMLLAKVHTEMARAPEEYETELRRGEDQNDDNNNIHPKYDPERETALSSRLSFLSLLPSATGSLPPIGDLPLISWDGAKTGTDPLEFKNEEL